MFEKIKKIPKIPGLDSIFMFEKMKKIVKIHPVLIPFSCLKKQKKTKKIHPKTQEGQYLGHPRFFCDFLTSRGLLDENPVLKIPSMDMPEDIPVCLTDDEVLQAYAIAEREQMLCEVVIALNTGLRMAELRRLEWKDVDLKRKQLIVRIAKGKRPRTVPLNQMSRTQLAEQQLRYGHLVYVFPGGETGGHIKSHWCTPTMRSVSWWSKRSIKCLQDEIQTLKDLPKGRTGRGWHALRHTFATRAIKADIDVVTLKDWMGHRKVETTLRYVHVARHYDERIELI